MDNPEDRTVRHPIAANVAVICILAAIPGAALAGFLGGGPPTVRQVPVGHSTATVSAPAVIRSGDKLQFEFELGDRAQDLRIGFEAPLMEGFAIDEIRPRPTGERVDRQTSNFLFAQPGGTGRVIISASVSSEHFGVNRGSILLSEGDAPARSIPWTIRVLP